MKNDTKSIKQLNTTRLNELSAKVGKWADDNFDVHLPLLGIFEEIGELAHCFLKRAQKIRGFDDPVKFHDEALDAISDIGIYGLHFAYKIGVQFESCENLDLLSYDNETEAISELSGMVVHIGRYEWAIMRLFGFLNLIAANNGIDFMEAIENTWAKVEKRNWRTNPKDANLASKNQ